MKERKPHLMHNSRGPRPLSPYLLVGGEKIATPDQSVALGVPWTEMNVCRVKTAAFGFQEPSKGARSYNFWLQMKKSGNHTYCKVRVTDNGNERLPCQNGCVWLSGAIKGGGALKYNF